MVNKLEEDFYVGRTVYAYSHNEGKMIPVKIVELQQGLANFLLVDTLLWGNRNSNLIHISGVSFDEPLVTGTKVLYKGINYEVVRAKCIRNLNFLYILKDVYGVEILFKGKPEELKIIGELKKVC